MIEEELDAGLSRLLSELEASPEVVVLHDPPPAVLEAYALEERLGVIAVVTGGLRQRVAALEAGAIEVLEPGTPLEEGRARLQHAVARFRSRLRLERDLEALARQAAAQESDLRLAARLQRSFLPRALPEVPGLRFATAYLPREFVSGDAYDVRQVAPDRVVLYTLDGMGHGVRAGLLSVFLRALFAAIDPDGARPPHEVVAELDRRVREADLAESPTAALCYGVLDLTTRRLALANAGHPLPVLLRPDGSAAPVGESGLLLGVVPEVYRTVEVELAPGDRLFLFTDGADSDYGDRFLEQLRLHRDLELEDQLGGALGGVLRLDDEGRPEDDVTVVAVEVLPAPPPQTRGAGPPAPPTR